MLEWTDDCVVRWQQCCIRHDQKREFELPSFRNSLDESAIPLPLPAGPGFQWHRLSSRRFGLDGRYHSFHWETHAGFDERFLRVTDGSRLRGYFQSWKYLHTVQDQLRVELWDIREPSYWFSEQSSKLKALGKWVGVHVRLGDYQDIQGMRLSEVYYDRAMALFRALEPIPQVVVFSDQIEVARTMAIWRSFPKAVFVENHPAARPVESMLLMSMADQLVIANSTFSWWSAWLGSRAGRRVIYPRPWGNTVCENRDLIPPDWLGVGRED